jgi:hypothetical protein
MKWNSRGCHGSLCWSQIPSMLFAVSPVLASLQMLFAVSCVLITLQNVVCSFRCARLNPNFGCSFRRAAHTPICYLQVPLCWSHSNMLFAISAVFATLQYIAGISAVIVSLQNVCSFCCVGLTPNSNPQKPIWKLVTARSFVSSTAATRRCFSVSLVYTYGAYVSLTFINVVLKVHFS